MSVGNGAFDRDQFLDPNKPLVAQQAAEGLDTLVRPIREVGKGALNYAMPFTASLAEQSRGTRAAVGHVLDVHGNYLNAISLKMQVLSVYAMGTLRRATPAHSLNPVKHLRPKSTAIGWELRVKQQARSSATDAPESPAIRHE